MANLATVLDMVKVMAFALQEGKIAVHCHAGLGRTGTFAKRKNPPDLSLIKSDTNKGSHFSSLQVCCWQVSWPMQPG